MTGPRRPTLRVLALLLLPLLARAEGELTTESPFLPSGEGAAAVQTANAVELRGILDQGGVHYFNLVDTATHKGSWVALNEPGPQGWTVRSYEQSGDSDTVTGESSGRTLRLPLAKPRTVKASPGAAAGVAAAAQPPQAQGPVTPVVLNPSPAQQAKAQEDIMAEVRRRRLQRQQAAGQPAPAQN